MGTEVSSPKTNRTPWIIAGVLGCLVLCLIVAMVGGGAYLWMNSNTASNTPTRIALPPTPVVPTVVVPTPQIPTVVVPSVPPVVVPTVAPQASSTPLTLQPSSSSSASTTASSSASSSASSTASSSSARPPAGPTGKIAFSKNEGDRPEDKYVWVMNADGTGAKKILDRASSPALSPDGSKIAFFRWTDGIFVANAADGTNSTKVVGDTYTRFLEYSHDGKWIAFTAQPGGSGNTIIDVAPPDGAALKDAGARRNVAVGFSPSWSPDDTELVFSTCRGNDCGVFKGKVTGGEPVLIVGDSAGLPAWSPNGKQILFQSKVDNVEQVFVMNPDGSGKKPLTKGPSLHVSANWSSDGNFIFYRSPEGGAWAIYRMNADGTNPVKLIDNVPPVNFAYEKLAVGK